MAFPSIFELKHQSFPDLKGKTSRWYGFWKRVFDIMMALAAFIILAPLWFFLIILIRLTSKGKIIFSHNRVGKDGKTFRLYKFRTMYEGVKNQELAPILAEDSRITKMGKFLRRTSLDEVPQLWNVLKGEMSLVGPRPEMPFIVAKYSDMQRRRLLVKPGMTGLWQILGRKDLPLHENIEYDFYYIQHQSFLLDLIILFKTAAVVISGKGAY